MAEDSGVVGLSGRYTDNFGGVCSFEPAWRHLAVSGILRYRIAEAFIGHFIGFLGSLLRSVEPHRLFYFAMLLGFRVVAAFRMHLE